MSRIITRGLALFIAIILGMSVATAEKPRLVINIVVGSMRSTDLDRYKDNFTDGGFRRLVDGGVRYTDAYYDFATTSTLSNLATLSTGTQPATHGVVGERWWSHIDGSKVELAHDNKAYAIELGCGSCPYSAHHLVAPTVGDMLLYANPESKLYTIALNPLTAIVLNGKSGVALWAESNKTRWITSSAYLDQLPSWLKRYNEEATNELYTLKRWTTLYEASRYLNSEVAVIEGIKNKSTQLISDVDLKLATDLYGKMLYTPAGNTMVLNLAKTLIAQERLGQDKSTDILNLSLDTARNIAEVYGPESMEYEDMLYRLDSQLAEFLTYVYAQFRDSRDVVVILTSAHGTSPSYNPTHSPSRERVNTRQIAVLTNAFLGARYGSASYVLGVANKSIYLNHNILNEKKLSINDIREEVATFLLQIRGIANALSASSLRSNSFSEGRSRLMQQGYYPTRSGDVLIDLMPGYIIDHDNRRSRPDGGYNYDRQVPLVVYRYGEGKDIDRRVSLAEVAPTISLLIGIETPWASEYRPLNEF